MRKLKLPLTRRVLPLACLAGTLTGCVASNPPQPVAISCPPPDSSETQARERSLGAAWLQTLQRDATIRRLEAQTGELEKKLSDAIQEAVRAKAKLRSLDSKAEAATTLADAEVVLRTVRAQVGRGEPVAELDQADALLAKSAAEFQAENYGGAFFLAANARSLLDGLQARLQRPAVSAAADTREIAFEIPLPMTLKARSKVRTTPNLDAPTLKVSETPLPVVARGYKDLWVLVEVADGPTGWVFHDLLEARR